MLLEKKGDKGGSAEQAAAASRDVGGVREVESPPPTLSPCSTFSPSHSTPSLSLSQWELWGRRRKTWKPRCELSGLRESVCCGRLWSPWRPAGWRSWWRWCRSLLSPSPPSWGQRLWSPSWLAMQRTAYRTTWAASTGSSTRRSA